MSRELLDKLLAGLGREVNDPGLCLDDDGLCAIRIDGNLVIEVGTAAEDTCLHLASAIGNLPEGEAAVLPCDLLEANHLAVRNGGAIFSFDSTTRSVFLNYTRPLIQIDNTEFLRLVENFISSAEFWAGRLAEPRNAGVAPLSLSTNRVDDPPPAGWNQFLQG